MTFHDDIASRLEDLRQREAAHREKSLRLHDAINKAITLVLTLIAVGGLTFLCAIPSEQQLKTSAAAELAETQRREADIEHRRTVNNSVVTALVACAGIDTDQAKKIVAHMVSGLIPNVTFTY